MTEPAKHTPRFDAYIDVICRDLNVSKDQAEQYAGDTASACVARLGDALEKLHLEIAKELRIPKLLDWLTGKLNR